MTRFPLYETRPIENLRDLLESSARLYGEKAAFLAKGKDSDEYQPISYNQYKKDVDAFGTALSSLGLTDKNIALISENRYPWSVSYLATLNGLGTIVPLDKELPENEIENLLKRSGAAAVIYGNTNAEQIENIARKIDTVEHYIHMDLDNDSDKALSFDRLLQNGHQLLAEGDQSFTSRDIDREAAKILLFTSGTTDISKGVMLSHKNLCENLMSMCSMLYIGSDDIFLSVLPIHHTYECTCGFLCPMYRGATVAYCEGLRHIPKNLKEAKATILLGVPLIYDTIYRLIWKTASKDPKTLRKLKTGVKISNLLRKIGIDMRAKLFKPIHDNFGGSIRLFISGAAALDPVVANGFQELGISIVQGYGLTECSPIVALNRDVYFKNDAAGLPLPNLEVKIDQPNEEGIGEIIVRGPSIMLGYFENPEATSQALKDGWFYTGDLGLIDSDGFVHITGRKKNVIITKNGKNIYPEEIETLLNRSPFILESMVFGQDSESGDDLTVAVQVVPDMEMIKEEKSEADISEAELYTLIEKEVKAVNSQLVSYKGIRRIIIRGEEFEKTTTRKIKRFIEEEKAVQE